METVDEVVGAILLLIAGHFAERDVTWFPRMLDGALLLGNKCSLLLLHLHLVGLMEELRERAIALWQSEQYLSASWANPLAEEEGRSGHAPSHAEVVFRISLNINASFPVQVTFHVVVGVVKML